MTKIFLVAFSLLISQSLFAQSKVKAKPRAKARTSVAVVPKPPVQYVQIDPELPGGVNSYLEKNTRYPDMARENDITGTVVVQYMIDDSGFVQRPVVLKGIGGGCDEKALRVIRRMPRWRPGSIGGRPMRVVFQQKVVFRLKE
jgi:TonB family protein